MFFFIFQKLASLSILRSPAFKKTKSKRDVVVVVVVVFQILTFHFCDRSLVRLDKTKTKQKLLDPLVVGPPGGGGGDDPAIINEYRCTGVSGEPCNCIVGPDNDLADTGVLVELVDGLTCVQTSAQCQGTHRNVFGGICPAPCTQSTDGRCFFESASGLGPTCSAEDRCIDDPRLFDELTRRMTLTQELMMQSTPLLLLPDDPTRSLSMESTSRTMLQRTPATISSPATIFSSEEQSENAVESNDDANTEQVVSNDDVAESNSSALLIGLICGGVCLVVGCIAFAVALRASSSSNATQRSNDSINESNASVNNQYGSINVDDKRPMAQDAVYSQSHSQNSSEYANAPELAHSQYDAY